MCAFQFRIIKHSGSWAVLPKVAWSRQSGVFGPPCGAIKFEVAWTRQSSKMWRLFMIWLRMSDLWRLQLKLWRLLPKSWQFLIFCEKNAILKILSWSKLWRLWPKMWLLFKVFLVAWFLAWFGKLVAFFKFRPLATLTATLKWCKSVNWLKKSLNFQVFQPRNPRNRTGRVEKVKQFVTEKNG